MRLISATISLSSYITNACKEVSAIDDDDGDDDAATTVAWLVR